MRRRSLNNTIASVRRGLRLSFVCTSAPEAAVNLGSNSQAYFRDGGRTLPGGEINRCPDSRPETAKVMGHPAVDVNRAAPARYRFIANLAFPLLRGRGSKKCLLVETPISA